MSPVARAPVDGAMGFDEDGPKDCPATHTLRVGMSVAAADVVGGNATLLNIAVRHR